MANLWRRSHPSKGADATGDRRRTEQTSGSPRIAGGTDDATEIIPAVTGELGPPDAADRPSADRPSPGRPSPDRSSPGRPSPGRSSPDGASADGASADQASPALAQSEAAADVAAMDVEVPPDLTESPAGRDDLESGNPAGGAAPVGTKRTGPPGAEDGELSDSGTQSRPVRRPSGPTRPVDTRRRLDDHLARVLSSIDPIDAIELTILDAQGLTLAEDIRAPRALPGFDNSAVDGYAVRAVDLRSAREDKPVILPVVGDVIAGARSVSGMGPGLAMRIMTGAPLPAGADAVVRIEDTDRGVARVGIRVAAQSGTAVRRAGEDMPAGQMALGEGAALGPQQIGLLAAIGRDRVLVHPRPRVVVISTGNELVEVGQVPGFGQVSDANSYLLTAAARDAGAEAYRVGIVADDHAQLMDVLESQLLRADIIVTSGGVSMGAYDVVKEALSELGTVEFVQVAMQPGKPQGFGYIGRNKTPIFCLPGNPVSSLVSFEMFVRPAIRKLLGKRRVERATVPAIALERIPGTAGTRVFRRGLLHREPDGSYSVSTVGGPGSHLIGALAASNCLIVVAEDLVEVVPGSRVPVIPLLLSQR